MILSCLSVVLWWSSFLLTGARLPGVYMDLGVAEVSNVSCSRVNIGGIQGNFNASSWDFSTLDPSDISCSMSLNMSNKLSILHSNIRLESAKVNLSKIVDKSCFSTNSRVEMCEFVPKIGELKLEPPNPFLQGLLNNMKKALEKQATDLVCNSGIEYIQQEMQNHTIDPPMSHPQLSPNATTLENSRMVRALVNVLNSAPVVFGIDFGASIQDGNTLHLDIGFPNGLHFIFDDSTINDLYMEKIKGIFNAFHIRYILDSLLKNLPEIKDGFLGMDISNPFNVSFEIFFHDLQCDEEGFYCSVPLSGGITFGNIRTQNLGEWDRLITSILGPFLAPVIDAIFDEVVSTNNTNDSRFYIPVLDEETITRRPSTAVIISTVIIVVLFTAVSIGLSFYNYYHRTKVVNCEGVPISLKRVLLEDSILIFLTVISTLGFTWSIATSISTLVVGGELHVISLTLFDTTKKMYKSGMHFFSILTFIFSGVYPYVKLIAIVVCTLVLQKPEMLLLKTINYIGKFSLLDSFAFVVMTVGLELQGIAELQFLSGFYVFLSSTLLSMFVGNYATIIWRRNTSLRRINVEREPAESGIIGDSLGKNNVEDSKNLKITEWRKKRVILAILNGAFILACTLPAWVVPCIGYRLGGLAFLVRPDDLEVSLSSIAATNFLFLITCIFTIGIVPLLYVIVYPNMFFLSSWSASDALLVACFAGFLQTGQLVDYMLGTDMRHFLEAETYLRWPLILLVFSTVWQWALVIENTFHVVQRMRICISKCRSSE
ncbi:uncharacterized protein TM35_000281830 [Trypanosoma theileri]|uniref:Paraquat-inducible protein A n=1 Tax=Trypanosoma theileri TaxID=67003 RepID=A0A1X0NP47_9TRYP|nr:uncharacterized protein TM35_000281830 [Trypanosoma theileri]ORC86467.1 hypothetical protein TM35_000281830 [Trypanosoma theileri]